MNEPYSQSRQTAEVAFGKAQSQSVARRRAFEELDLIVVARDEKTGRLREARLAKESQDLLASLATKTAKISSRT